MSILVSIYYIYAYTIKKLLSVKSPDGRRQPDRQIYTNLKITNKYCCNESRISKPLLDILLQVTY